MSDFSSSSLKNAKARQLYLEHYGRYPERYLANLDDVVAKQNDLLLSFDVLKHVRDEDIANVLDNVRSVLELLFNISRTRGTPSPVNINSDRA